jgi:hypothetical protein
MEVGRTGLARRFNETGPEPDARLAQRRRASAECFRSVWQRPTVGSSPRSGWVGAAVSTGQRRVGFAGPGGQRADGG